MSRETLGGTLVNAELFLGVLVPCDELNGCKETQKTLEGLLCLETLIAGTPHL